MFFDLQPWCFYSALIAGLVLSFSSYRFIRNSPSETMKTNSVHVRGYPVVDGSFFLGTRTFQR